MPQILFYGTGSAKKDAIIVISICIFFISIIVFLAIYGEKIGVKSEGDIRGIWSILIAVFLISAYAFFEGFRDFRIKQLIEGTATSKIRSLAIGFAEVYGKITPLKMLKSPITNHNCAYWRVIIMGAMGAQKGLFNHDKSSTEELIIKDETGSILVEPKDAQFERLSVGLSYGMPILADYPTIFFGIKFPGNLDFEESKSIKVIAMKRGTLFERKPPAGSAPQPGSQFRLTDDQLERLKKFCEQEGITIRDYNNFAVVEYYLPPNMNMYVLGTVAENPNEPNNMLIKKGEYVDLLYISDKPEKEIANRLGKRAKNWIVYGGAAAAVSLFAMLLERDVVFGSALPGTIIMAIGSLIIISRKGFKIITNIVKIAVYILLMILAGITILFLVVFITVLSKGEGQIQETLVGLTLVFLVVAFMAYIIRGVFRALRSM